MSFPYSQDARRRRVGAGTGFSSSGRRTVLGYWVPLALTVGIATVGIAAWIWSERSEDDDDENDRDRRRDEEPFPAPGPGSEAYPAGGDYEGMYARSTATDVHGGHPEDASMMARMQGALRRTPSPQQILDGASKRVAAGMAAAGAFVGGALTSIREEDRGDFEDHSRWSEEVESRANQREQPARAAPTTREAVSGPILTDKKKRKTIAIVVSSETPRVDPEEIISQHASILSHLPEHVNLDTTRVFIMIYAPGLKHAPSQGGSSPPTLSVTSSYSNIAPEEATSPGEVPGRELSGESRATDEHEGTTPLFRTLYTQAQALVEKPNTIMPFSTTTGFVHLVRHISPDTVYVQESLAGKDGEAVHHISGWVRQVVVVVGDEGGRGGLIDSDDESALADKGERWWQKEGTTGLGKRIDVVDALRVGDDWRRRVSGFD
ncbi:hypothetical protein ASPACDRAFT_1851553 [Aspergillus aculeatus ATCC 16872]|uniref:Peroxin-22-like protein Pex22-like-Penicillium chrysogenum n=1 Tax=Aspergillus aculeatus (strain ATCC 16872 / CBS 172.66 / WB 5094) TaxID=690307 RepID=A0A1L9X806_ASPA1|nr:uncharacterized protein ASPACDRAFT_1851553 [Aspergillus aculeatus ATCC 16872]OJK04575.1 hypothetical protein ASPACDRAFT_1851553 [Aspergillus aculeatus ATCC 16872]